MNFIKPSPGDKVPMICLNCKKRFSGNYQESRLKKLLGLGNKCPECGSRKVVVDPSIKF